jgi:NADH dehydrogenase
VLSLKAAKALGRLGVVLRLGTTVTDLHPERVTVQAAGVTEVIPCHTVLWGAGVQASPLGKKLADAAGARLDRAGRVLVEKDMTVPGRPEVFVIGDLASYSHQTGQPLPGVAQVALQQGQYVADLIGRRLRGAEPLPFHYRDPGSMATIGRAAAVVDLGWVRFDGYLAWLAWLFIHLIYLIEFQSRLLVLMQWAWNYFTRNRSARLITGETEAASRPAAS